MFVDGTNITTALRPFLISVSVTDKAGSASDTCSLSLDDTGGQIRLPARGAGVVVVLQGVRVFSGHVDSAPWSFSRRGGRVLRIKAEGFDIRGKAKEGQAWHLDDASLEDALKKAGERAGVSMIVDPALASVMRDYWSPDGRSLLAWGQELAREFHATFGLRCPQPN